DAEPGLRLRWLERVRWGLRHDLHGDDERSAVGHGHVQPAAVRPHGHEGWDGERHGDLERWRDQLRAHVRVRVRQREGGDADAEREWGLDLWRLERVRWGLRHDLHGDDERSAVGHGHVQPAAVRPHGHEGWDGERHGDLERWRD